MNSITPTSSSDTAYASLRPLPLFAASQNHRSPTCHKFTYATKRDATTTCNARMRRSRTSRKRPALLRAYHCPNCNAWHLTHHELNTY